MKALLCIVLGIYSVGVVVYSLSGATPVKGACVNCYKGETSFQGGEGSGATIRMVNYRFNDTGNNAFTGENATKINTALSIASINWTTIRDENGQPTPYYIRPSQNESPNIANLGIMLVDEIPGNKKACMGIQVVYNPDGSVRKGFISVKRSVMENLNTDEIARLLEHEIGHFLGLRDNKNRNCQSAMSQATEGCHPISTGIQPGDATKVNDYVSNPEANCKNKRPSKPQSISTGGTTEPPAIPNYYPRTCYYYYDAIDIYLPCVDCTGGQRYIGTIYYLTDVFCF